MTAPPTQDKAYSTRQKTANLQGKFRIPPRKICIPIRIQILATTRVRHSGGLGAQPSTSPVCGDTMGMQCIPMCVPAYGTCPNTPYREDLQTRCFSPHLFGRGNPEEKENTDSLFIKQDGGVQLCGIDALEIAPAGLQALPCPVKRCP